MGEKQYTIGQVAKICNLTTQQLRHYEKKNIICPSGRVDENNYRYYTHNQIDDILLIKELKKIELPLKTIAVLVRNKELVLIKSHLEENMLHLREEVEQMQRQYNQLIDVLLRVSDAVNLLKDRRVSVAAQDIVDSFQIVDIPRRTIVSTRYASNLSVFSNFITRYAELLNVAEQNDIHCSGPIMAVFHEHYIEQFSRDSSESQGDLEIFMNADSKYSDTPHTRLFGGFKAVSAVHIGSYETSYATYDAMEKWARNQGHALSGISFQEFVVGRTMSDQAEDYVTRIYMPINCKSI